MALLETLLKARGRFKIEHNSNATEGSNAGQKRMGGARPGQGTVTVERVKFVRSSDLIIRMEIGRCLDHDPELSRVLSIPSCRILGVILPLPHNTERASLSSGDGAARQRAPVDNPLNDEQWSDRLYDPPSH